MTPDKPIFFRGPLDRGLAANRSRSTVTIRFTGRVAAPNVRDFPYLSSKSFHVTIRSEEVGEQKVLMRDDIHLSEDKEQPDNAFAVHRQAQAG